MALTPLELMNLITTSKYTKGIEVAIDFDNEFQRKYLEDLVYEVKKNNMILQVHADSALPIDKQLEFMHELEKYSDELEYPIVVTIHTVYDEDKEVSKQISKEYFHTIIDNVDSNKIILSVENLNDSEGMIRLDKDDIVKTVVGDSRIFCTYDIGHEIANYGKITDINRFILEEIRNVHIHTHDNKGNDHMPIYKDDIHWNEITKGLLFLIKNNYQYNIVYEYALEFCHGEDTKERVLDYLSSIDFVSEKYAEL